VEDKQEGTKLLLIGKWLVPESNVRVWKNSPDSHLWMAGAPTRNRAMHKYFTGTLEIKPDAKPTYLRQSSIDFFSRKSASI
jgi:hypothetical protein